MRLAAFKRLEVARCGLPPRLLQKCLMEIPLSLGGKEWNIGSVGFDPVVFGGLESLAEGEKCF